MDLNKLLSRHQVALYQQTEASSGEERRWAQQCVAFYAAEIDKLRMSFGRSTPMTWALEHVATSHG